MNNKRLTKNILVLIQISILIISLVAFTNIISAQISSSPLPTSAARKTVIQSDQSDEESEENTQAPITGLAWAPFPAISVIGEKFAGFLSGLFGEISISLGSIVTNGIFISAVVFGLTLLIVGVVSGDIQEGFFWASAAGGSLGLGFGLGSLSGGLAAGFGASATLIPVIGWTVGVIVAIWMFWRSTMKADQRTVVFDCRTWQSQTGGHDCTECNGNEFPCTEYQCRSLGQACELLNEGDNARCVHRDPGDIASPEIIARVDSLLSDKYSYEPIPATLGVEIKYDDEDATNGDCLPSFESFTYGIELNKEGTCRIADQRTDSFSDMVLPFGGGLWERNHTQIGFFPGQPFDEEGTELPGGGNYEFYVRCESVNGYANVEEFLFRFCIDPDPDITQPLIQGFSLQDETPLRYFDETEEPETDVIIYVNEPLFAEDGGCRWSHTNKEYKEMEGEMSSCFDSIVPFTTFDAQISYSCDGTLTGLQNGVENKFYFRCNDSFGNVNTQSKELILIGSRPLVIDSVGPSGELRGSSNEIKVPLVAKTSSGYENGKADCYYSATGDYNDYTKFENTRSHEHSDNSVYLEGRTEPYTYHIQCFDMAGNVEVVTTTFNIETDTTAPIVVRAYHEAGKLKLITNEPAKCVYSTNPDYSCSYDFDVGISMTSSDDITHSMTWNTNDNLYIKCKDLEYGTPPTGCSIILRPFEFF